MELTERQKEILSSVVMTHIDTAEPVSSKFLERKYKFGISPATIRIEMQKLTDAGFISQPHTSAGRLPTDKGYRFFVNKLLEEEIKSVDVGDWLGSEFKDTVNFFQSLTKRLALESHSLVFGYLKDKDIFWKEGWEGLLREPEFGENEFLLSFTELLQDFEKNIADLKVNSEIKIYIGRENPWKSARDFSIISARCYLPDNEEGTLSLMGPKRMDYKKNINLVNSLNKLLDF